MIRPEDVAAARRMLQGVAVKTPLIPCPGGDGTRSLFFKPESLQPTGAFKLRGAYNAIVQLSDEQRRRGVVAHSSGNHGQAVAYAARRFGLRAVIVMPASAPAIKVEGVRRHGGEVVLAGATRSAEQQLKAEQLAREQRLAMIPPYDHPDIIAGQGTCGLEILEQRPDVETILVPVSGGGLIAGICVAVGALKPTVRVIGVEPEGAAKLSAALVAGEPRTLERTASMADGLLARSVGHITFPILRTVVREAVRVSEENIADAVRFLYREAGLSVEPSGAVATAALLAGRVRPTGPTVAVLSGGNVDPQLFQRLVRA